MILLKRTNFKIIYVLHRSLSEADCLHEIVGSPTNRPKLNVAKDSKDHKHLSLNGKTNDRCTLEEMLLNASLNDELVCYHINQHRATTRNYGGLCKHCWGDYVPKANIWALWL